MKKTKLFALNLRVRKFYYTTESACCQRFSNNSEPKFTDIQATTIYLYGMKLGFPTKQCVYNFAKEHLKKYCEHLPTYKQKCGITELKSISWQKNGCTLFRFRGQTNYCLDKKYQIKIKPQLLKKHGFTEYILVPVTGVEPVRE